MCTIVHLHNPSYLSIFWGLAFFPARGSPSTQKQAFGGAVTDHAAEDREHAAKDRPAELHSIHVVQRASEIALHSFVPQLEVAQHITVLQQLLRHATAIEKIAALTWEIPGTSSGIGLVDIIYIRLYQFSSIAGC